jgi:hypothetical protein
VIAELVHQLSGILDLAPGNAPKKTSNGSV